jgi:hypothetical protein
MKALVFENKVVDLVAQEFQVSPSMVWMDAPEDCQTGWLLVGNELQAPPAKTTTAELAKSIAKEKIALTDWAVLPDVNLQNKAEFEAYRATLRDLIFNPVADPVWPVEPTPIPATQGA